MSSHPEAGTLTLFGADLALATDLYQLTMAAAYHAWDRDAGGEPARATFDLWVRRLPPTRRFLVFAGLETALASLRALAFDADRVAWLRTLPPFAGVDDSFFDHLAGFRFRGDVRAMEEGTVFFPGEPVLSVTGSLIEAQLVETLLLSIVNFQTAIASKAARLRLAAGDSDDGGAGLAEFGTRRAHGPQAGVWAARAAYVGGVDTTSNVAAGWLTGVPLVGTMAHSFVMAHESEIDAFRRYQGTFPDHTILLVDTYDTLRGVERALASGGPFDGVRLDSGDLGELARGTRRLLDAGGRPDATVFASGDMNEHRIAELREAGAPIDAYGVGTQLATSADAPYLSGVYKLVRVERGGEVRQTFKASPGKETYPGPKQVVRRIEEGDDGSRLAGDRVLRLEDAEDHLRRARDEDGRLEPLLRTVMRGGEVVPADERGRGGPRPRSDGSAADGGPLSRTSGGAAAGGTERQPRDGEGHGAGSGPGGGPGAGGPGAGEPMPGGDDRRHAFAALTAARRRCRVDLERLPAVLRLLEPRQTDDESGYTVVVDDALKAELRRLRREEA